MEPIVCKKGYYCEIGVSQPQKCPKGTFAPSENLRKLADCTDCFAGRFCSQEGLEWADGECDPGTKQFNLF